MYKSITKKFGTCYTKWDSIIMIKESFKISFWWVRKNINTSAQWLYTKKAHYNFWSFPPTKKIQGKQRPVNNINMAVKGSNNGLCSSNTRAKPVLTNWLVAHLS